MNRNKGIKYFYSDYFLYEKLLYNSTTKRRLFVPRAIVKRKIQSKH